MEQLRLRIIGTAIGCLNIEGVIIAAYRVVFFGQHPPWHAAGGSDEPRAAA